MSDILEQAAGDMNNNDYKLLTVISYCYFWHPQIKKINVFNNE